MRQEKGQGLVEFALIVPLLLLVVFGVFEFGRLLFFYSVSSSAAREAARYGTAAGAIGFGGVPRYLDCNGIRSSGLRLGSLVGMGQNDIQIAYDSGPGGTELGTCGGSDIIGGFVDVNNDKVINGADDGFWLGFQVINGAIDINGSNTISSTDNGTAGGFDVIAGRVDVDGNGSINSSDNFGGAVDPTEVTVGTRVKITTSSTFRLTFPVFDIGPLNISSTSYRTIVPSIPVGTPIPLSAPLSVSFVSTGQVVAEADMVIDVIVQLSSAAVQSVTVPFTVGGTAALEDDYFISNSPIVIPAGATTAVIQVTIFDDGEPEFGDETIQITLGFPTNAILTSPSSHTITIQGLPILPMAYFLQSGQTVNETTGSLNIPVQLSNSYYQDVVIPFSITAGDAVDGVDYVISASPLIIPANAFSGVIQVTIQDDLVDELAETFQISLGTPVNANLGTPTVYDVAIIDDDVPVVQFSTTSTSVNEEVGTVNVQVSLDRVPAENVTIPFTIGGTALINNDYTISASPVVIPAGSQTGVIAIAVVNQEGVEEALETIVLTLGTPTNATLGTNQVHTVRIAGETPLPDVSFASAGQFVDEPPILQPTIQINLTQAFSLGPVTIEFSLGGTAVLGSDYTITASPVTISPGSTSAILYVNIIDDPIREVDETIVITIGTITNGEPGSTLVHTITIRANDPEADLSLTLTANKTKPFIPDSNRTLGLDNDLFKVTFSVFLSSEGPDTAENVAVQALLPPGYTYISHEAPLGSTYTSATGIWAVPSISPGATQLLKIVAQPNATNDYTLYAEIKASSRPDPDSTPSNNSVDEDDDYAVETTPESECAVSTTVAQITSDKLTWSVKNNGSVNYRLTYVRVPWTQSDAAQRVNSFDYNSLRMVSDDRSPVLTVEETATPADFAWPNNSENNRALPGGSTRTLLFVFQKNLYLTSANTITGRFFNTTTNYSCTLVQYVAPTNP